MKRLALVGLLATGMAAGCSYYHKNPGPDTPQAVLWKGDLMEEGGGDGERDGAFTELSRQSIPETLVQIPAAIGIGILDILVHSNFHYP